MKVLLGTIVCVIVCTITLILPILAAPPRAPPPLPPPPQYKTITWDFSKVQQYGQLIASLRKDLGVSTVCGIPSTADPPNPPAFILVKIINKKKVPITIALRKSNVYFVGYMDMVGTDTRANFVADELTDLERDQLFSDAKIKPEDKKDYLPFGVSYVDLERAAGVDRADLRLGVDNLSPLMDVVNGADYAKSKQDLAKFALMVIQMVAEGARFKYISEIVLKQGTKDNMSFLPDDTFIRLQTNWGTISELIHNSSPGCQPVKVPGFPAAWNDIKPQVGLLKFKGSRRSVEGTFDNNDDDDNALESM